MKTQPYLLIFILFLMLFSCTETTDDVDTVPPNISWVSPNQDNVQVSGLYRLEVNAYDNNLMAGVVFMLGMDTLGVANRGSGNVWSLLWDTHQYGNGDTLDNLNAIAMDQVGLVNSPDPRRININNVGVPPIAPELISVSPPDVGAYFDKYRLKLSWTESKDVNFSHYILLRDNVAFTTAGNREFYQIHRSDSITFIDSLSNMDTGRYYYAVMVMDDSLPSNLSNVDYGETGVLTDTITVQVDERGKHNIALKWDKTDDAYFKNYLIYRSENGSIDTSLMPTGNIDKRYEVHYYDEELTQSTTFTYGLVVEDVRGMKYLTNTLNIATTSLMPVEISGMTDIGKYGMLVNWPYSHDIDVIGYHIKRNGNTVAEIEGRFTNQYQDSGLNQGEEYSYTLVTVDSLETKESDAFIVQTQSIVPVTLLSAQSGHYNINVNWTQYESNDNDFNAYTVKRRSTGGWSTRETIADISTLQYGDYDALYGIEYEYAIVVSDTNGGTAQSNGLHQHVRQLNRANVNEVSVNTSGNLQINWEWADQSESNFNHYEIMRYSHLYVNVNGVRQYLNNGIPNPLPHTPIADDSTVIQSISSISTQQFTDTGVTHNSGIYGYRIFVVDAQGNSEMGNMSGNYEGEGIFPEDVELNEATNITSHSAILNWMTSQPGNTYHIYSDFYADSLSLTHSTLHKSVTGITNAMIDDLQSGLRYYFCIWTEDNYGNISDQSNIIEVETSF